MNDSNYETTLPTVTSDRICGGTVPVAVTSSVALAGSERLSAGADVGIGIAVLLVLAGAGVGFMYYTKSHKQKDALHELLLEETRGEKEDIEDKLEEATGLNSRMLNAWQIKVCDVELGGTPGTGWRSRC